MPVHGAHEEVNARRADVDGGRDEGARGRSDAHATRHRLEEPIGHLARRLLHDVVRGGAGTALGPEISG